MGSFVTNLFRPLYHLFFPRCCVVCGNRLAESVEGICVGCNINLPRTNYHNKKDNYIERMFWGKMPIERASSYFIYSKGGDYRQILYQLKYNGRKDLGCIMGRMMSEELYSSGFFDGVDVIIPVPLHYGKQKLRGYNQSEFIARGISKVTHIPVDATSVIRHKHTDTQTRKSVIERWDNVNGIFHLHNPATFHNKHILIVDDVLTTGSTITACADAFAGVDGIRISVLTLAMAE